MTLILEAENTNKELWRDPKDTMNFDKIFITVTGHVGLCFGGRCVVKSLKDWVELGWKAYDVEWGETPK